MMKMSFCKSMPLQVSTETLETTTVMEDTQPCERFIDFYFELGLNYKDIKTVLDTVFKQGDTLVTKCTLTCSLG